jgi:hypothetical protein
MQDSMYVCETTPTLVHTYRLTDTHTFTHTHVPWNLTASGISIPVTLQTRKVSSSPFRRAVRVTCTSRTCLPVIVLSVCVCACVCVGVCSCVCVCEFVYACVCIDGGMCITFINCMTPHHPPHTKNHTILQCSLPTHAQSRT